MNKFFTSEPVDFVPPRRLYARIHDLDQDLDSEIEMVLSLDCVDAKFIDDNIDDLASDALSDFWQIMPLFALELSVANDSQFVAFANEDPSQWLELNIDENAEGQTVSVYGNLFSPAINMTLTPGYPKSIPYKKIRAALEQATSMTGIHDATEEVLRSHLKLEARQKGVAVYDVGQGNCNAIIGDQLNPVIYYDFGGGIMGNGHTFPRQNQNMKFCFTNSPTIILSHWDWDHWSSAFRDLESLNQIWIAPHDTSIGLIHRYFLDLLFQNKKILIWPDTLDHIDMGYMTIRKANGSSRNDKGLILEIMDPYGERPPVLFMGDADYGCFKGKAPLVDRDWSVVVAPHHGAKMRSNRVPSCMASNYHRLIYSVGSGNSYGHPKLETETLYRQANWREIRYTSDRNGDFGHVYWFWPPLDSQTKEKCVIAKLLGACVDPPCGRRCDLQICQV